MATPEETALAAGLRELLGSMYAMYFRAHGAHWNVEGPFFGPLHGFFGDIYEDVFGSIDQTAEYLRFHHFYAPYTISGIQRINPIADTPLTTGDPIPLLTDLLSVNSLVLQALFKLKPLADGVQDLGLSNFIDERINAHNKWAWQIRSHLKAF